MTLNAIAERTVDCPYCGESIDILIDPSTPEQDYVEDCQVCCRPMNISVTVEMDGRVGIITSSDRE